MKIRKLKLRWREDLKAMLRFIWKKLMYEIINLYNFLIDILYIVGDGLINDIDMEKVF